MRRQFVGGLVAGGAAATTGLGSAAALAMAPRAQPAVLRGTDFDFEIAPLPVTLEGERRRISAIAAGAAPTGAHGWPA